MGWIKRMLVPPGELTFSGVPDHDVLAALAAAHVDLVWVVAAELGHLVPTLERIAQGVLWTPIPDFGVPHDRDVFLGHLDRVCTVLRAGGRIHVCCYGGRGRTGLALACVRVRMGEQAEDALRFVLQATDGPETNTQTEFVRGLLR